MNPSQFSWIINGLGGLAKILAEGVALDGQLHQGQVDVLKDHLQTIQEAVKVAQAKAT